MIPRSLFSYLSGVSAADILAILDNSDYDELVEIDTLNFRFATLAHTEDKYVSLYENGDHAEAMEYAASSMVHPEDRAKHAAFMDMSTIMERLSASVPRGLIHEEFRYRLLDGGWCFVDQVVIGGITGLPDGVIRVYVFDIQRIKLRQLKGGKSVPGEDMYRDERTGLLPEKAFFGKAEKLFRDKSKNWCMITVDIEYFRLFNEWYGRDVGDLLISELGAKIAEFERNEHGAAGYLGQDDYCIFVPYDEEKIKNLHWELSRVIVTHGSSFGFIPVFGVCIAEGKVTVAELYDRATIAQNNAKANFQNRISLFNSSMYDQTDNEYRILSDFRKGIRNHEFFFVLQPQCRASTGKIVGAESLARWRKADGSIVSPGIFVPVLEKYGFITVLDKYIWEEVCIWLRKWIDKGHEPLPVSVNVSQIDIFNMDIADFFEALVEKYRLSNDMLKIEITESAYVENGSVVKDTVAKLREKGFLVLMDDFGSGYSSLNMLRSLNVDIIKLDAQFLTTGESDTVKGVHIIEAIINMVKTLELPIIVEGVEYPEQRKFLEDLGCRYVQGYYFYRPMPVDSFEQLISDQDKVDHRGFVLKHNEQFRIIDFLDNNIYSDTMLNNILGAVCIYGWHGDSVDIVRYNEQFYKMVDVPDFADRLTDIQRFMPQDERRRLFCAMKKAMKDRLNGSIREMTFIKSDGTQGRYNLHLYYLGETETGGEKRFYCSVSDVTEVTLLHHQMKLLSKYSSESVVFVSNTDSLAGCSVSVFGLGSRLGIDQAQFEREMNDGSFLDRVDEKSANKLNAIIDAEPGTGVYSFPISYTCPSGEVVPLMIKVDPVHDSDTDVDYILIIRENI